MERKSFLKWLGILPLTAAGMTLHNLRKWTNELNTETSGMPVLFLGHGSPMNAIEENEFVRGFRQIGQTLPRPRAILCISAHWETRGTYVTAMENPRTIHDFGGFPRALFDVQYPAPGSPELAKETKAIIHTAEVGLDESWGLDHGAWSVVKHLYPEADVPIIQMSLDRFQTPQYHYDLAKELSILRNKGVSIVGSGNMVHNLGRVAWDKQQTPGFAYDWALEAGEKMKSNILDGNHQELIQYQKQGEAFSLSIPTPEHYLPLLYILALQDKKDKIQLFNDSYLMGSLSMTSVMLSPA